ncbi:MAG: MBL fold metallo-hydrolase [Acinetobacter sp.]|nr:MAG: MBL fold metallo-hydrolase [Acinetobacter sp.]
MANQKPIAFRKWTLSLLGLFIIAGTSAQTTNAPSKAQIYHIQSYFSEAYLIKGNSGKLILVETGVPTPGYQDSLINSIKKLGFDPKNISLAIVTHGHGDHAGNARFLQEKYHVAIAGSKRDLGKFISGKTELSKSEDVSIWGNRLRAYSDLSYPPFTPDLLVGDVAIDLAKYGVNGKIIPIKGGHTPGDLLVLIGKDLFVGDAFVGTFKAQGGGLVADGHHIREHFYHENKTLADQNLQLIAKIVAANKVTTLYPTHNGPVSSLEFTKYLKEEPLLRQLTKQNDDLLAEVANRRTASLKILLSDGFILQAADGKQYGKDGFLNTYILSPQDKIETLASEDFRIVYSDENTATATFIENLKLEGKDPKSFFVNQTYSKINGAWYLSRKKVDNP